jgi:imidazolonepropionase
MTLFTNISQLHTFARFAAKNGRQPTVSDDVSIESAAILVSEKGIIQWVGAQNDFAAFSSSKTAAWRKKVRKVSLKNAVVLPALTECHTHLLYDGSRAEEFERRNRGDSYLQIAADGGGIRSTVLATAAGSKIRHEKLLIERLSELRDQGATTVEIKTGYFATIEEEARALDLLMGLRKKTLRLKLPRIVITCLAAHSIPEGETEVSWLSKVETLLPKVRKAEARLDIFIEKGAFSLNHGGALLEKAKAEGLAVSIHADQLSRSGGTSLGAKLGALSVDHVIEIGDDEISELASTNTVAVLLPAADMYTRLPYPKARAMIDAGVRVALATDHNPGTSPGLDLALVGVLARTVMQMSLPEVYVAYTLNAAAALGLDEKLGALQPGFFADFICLEQTATLADLFYEIGPRRTHAAITEVWREGHRIASRSL